MSDIRLPIRQLVEFLLRTGSIDSRFTGFDRALEGARIHRKLQKAAGEDYQAEVFLSAERQAEGLTFLLDVRTAFLPTVPARRSLTRSRPPPSPMKRSPRI